MSEPLAVEPTSYEIPGRYAGATAATILTAYTDDDVTAEHEYGEDDPEHGPPVPADGAAALPLFESAESSAIVEPFLSVRESATISRTEPITKNRDNSDPVGFGPGKPAATLPATGALRGAAAKWPPAP